MRRFLVVICALVVGCGSAANDEPIVVIDTMTTPNNATTDTHTQTDANTVVTGAELFTLHCQTCHGPDATGTPTWSGSIRGLQISKIVTEGRETMAPVAIGADEIGLIQEYLDSFGVVQSELSGRDIFENRCSPCHGKSGEGTTKSFRIQFMKEDFGNWIVRNGRDTTQFVGAMPAYPADEISDAQYGEIVDYMWNQPWPSGGEALYTTFCSNCHGMDGRSGYVGKRIAGEGGTRIVRQGHGGNFYASRRSYMPSWSQAELSDSAVASIASYVNSL